MSKYRALYDSQGLKAEFQDGELVWCRQEPIKGKKTHYNLILDIQPYKSMVDGTMITSRSQHREHLQKHNCFEVGNEKMQNTPPPVVNNRREMLHRRLGDMSDRQANVILKQLRRT